MKRNDIIASLILCALLSQIYTFTYIDKVDIPYIVIIGLYFLAIVSLVYFYLDNRREDIPPPINYCCGAPTYTSYEEEKRVTKFCTLPLEVLKYIKEQNWKVIDVGAGSNHNKKLLEEYGIDVIAYDAFTHDGIDVMYGLAGCVEKENKDRALMLLSTTDACKSVAAYTGDIVILGGYLGYITGKEKVVHVIKNLNEPDKVSRYINVDTDVPRVTDSKENRYEVVLVPTHDEMKECGWEMVKTFYADPGEANYCVSLHRIYVIWRRK